MEQTLYLALVFLAIVVLLALRRPLYQALLGGLACAVLLYRIPLPAAVGQAVRVFTDWRSCSVLVSLYLITYLQRMLEAREKIRLARQDLNGLFHNRRINAAGAPLFIGLLPSAAAMILCADIVKDATEGYLNAKEQAFVTSWFRHIPESTLPTYTSVLLMSALSGVPLSRFMLCMLPPAAVLFLLGWLPCLSRLPKDPGTPPSADRRQDALGLVRHLWPLLLILLLILTCGVHIVTAVLISIATLAAADRFRAGELVSMLRSAFEVKLLLNTLLVLILKEFIAWTGVLAMLPELLSGLPVSSWAIFALLFFVGAIVSSSNGIIALGAPLAFAAAPGDLPLMVLLMCVCHGAYQLSPTHVCLVVASDYFQVSLGDLVRKTLPRSLLFCLFAAGYYLLLSRLF